jgi:hypothetical protein
VKGDFERFNEFIEDQGTNPVLGVARCDRKTP